MIFLLESLHTRAGHDHGSRQGAGSIHAQKRDNDPGLDGTSLAGRIRVVSSARVSLSLLGMSPCGTGRHLRWRGLWWRPCPTALMNKRRERTRRAITTTYTSRETHGHGSWARVVRSVWEPRTRDRGFFARVKVVITRHPRAKERRSTFTGAHNLLIPLAPVIVDRFFPRS